MGLLSRSRQTVHWKDSSKVFKKWTFPCSADCKTWVQIRELMTSFWMSFFVAASILNGGVCLVPLPPPPPPAPPPPPLPPPDSSSSPLSLPFFPLPFLNAVVFKDAASVLMMFGSLWHEGQNQSSWSSESVVWALCVDTRRQMCHLKKILSHNNVSLEDT